MEKIAAVIVTYNKLNELKLNIESLNNQSKKFDKIYVVNNNSTDGTKEFLNQLKLKNSCYSVINFDNNAGGAGGFYEGLRQAHKEAYDFIVLMDDDGRPMNSSTIANLYSKARELKNHFSFFILNSLVLYDSENLTWSLSGSSKIGELNSRENNGLLLNSINPFNGTLISKSVIDVMGLPRKDFFIWGDESEYIRRAKNYNVFLATCLKSKFYHPINREIKQINLIFRKIKLHIPVPWKNYYRIRNSIIIENLYGNKASRNKLIILFLQSNFFYVLFSRNRIKMIKSLIMGIFHGLNNKTGRVDI